jgi:hypothetical protein
MQPDLADFAAEAQMSARENVKASLAWARLVYQDLWNNTEPLDLDGIDAEIRRLFRLEGTIPEFAQKWLVDWYRNDLGRLQDGRTARKDQTARRDYERALKIEEKILANGKKSVTAAIAEVLIEEKKASGKSVTTELTEGQLRQGLRSWASRKRLIHPMWFERPKKWIEED